MKLPPSRATLAIGVLTAGAWICANAISSFDLIAMLGGFIPERLSPDNGISVFSRLGIGDAYAVPAWLTPLSATLVHNGFAHLAFNLLMLGFCGRFVEVGVGVRGLIILYAAGAYAAAAAQLAVDPDGIFPMVGASGAVSALFGAYALLFGERRGRLKDHRFGRALHVIWLAAAWIGFQLLVGLAMNQEGKAIATAAHIGGFLAGLVLAKPLLRLRHRLA